MTETWTVVPPDVAAQEWTPPPAHSTPSPEPFVARVRQLLASGGYKQVIAPDGHAFVGTEAECDRHMLVREDFLAARAQATAQARATLEAEAKAEADAAAEVDAAAEADEATVDADA